MPIAVDFSTARPTIAELHAADVVLVIRYLTGPGAKPITLAELNEYVSNGIVVVFVFENLGTDAEGGFAAGVANARAAVKAMSSLGITACPIYFAVDQSINPAGAINYFQGICGVLQPAFVGVYGEGALCTLLQTEGLATFFWQSESTSFPGNAHTLAISHLQQVYNASPVPGTDLDLILKGDVGQWPRPVVPVPVPEPGPHGPTPAPNPVPSPPKEKAVLIVNDGTSQYWVFESGRKLAIPDGPDFTALASVVPALATALTPALVAAIPNV